MRNRAFRRHKANAKMMRRLRSDRNQHYRDLTCPCWTDPRAMARFKEQPQLFCRCPMCSMDRYERKSHPRFSERRQGWIE